MGLRQEMHILYSLGAMVLQKLWGTTHLISVTFRALQLILSMLQPRLVAITQFFCEVMDRHWPLEAKSKTNVIYLSSQLDSATLVLLLEMIIRSLSVVTDMLML